MYFRATAPARRYHDADQEWDWEDDPEVTTAEQALAAAQDLFGLGMFRGPITILDEQGNVLLREGEE